MQSFTYIHINNIYTHLQNSTVEELLDEEDILQECKTLKKNLVNYFTRPEVIRRLVELITTEPSEEVPMAQRFRYANMSCEILTLYVPPTIRGPAEPPVRYHVPRIRPHYILV